MLTARHVLEAPCAASAARLLHPVISASAAVGVLLLNLVFMRFETPLLAVLGIRASVDWTKVPCDVGGPGRHRRFEGSPQRLRPSPEASLLSLQGTS